MNLVSSRLIKLAAPFALGLLAACGAGVDNMGADGSYGFDGAGWTRVESASKADKFEQRGQLLPRERVARLLDRDSGFLPLCPLAGAAALRQAAE